MGESLQELSPIVFTDKYIDLDLGLSTSRNYIKMTQ